MCRVTTTIVLLLALLWQSVALASAGSTLDPIPDPAHSALHWQDEGHHHHEDRSYDRDDSAESMQHLMADHVSAFVGLLHAVPTSVPPSGSSRSRASGEDPGPHPFLDGPLKPPRVTA